MTPDPSASAPSTVGRYVLHGEIASGGMATVHFGRLQGAAGFARSVAIKRLHPQYAKDPDFVAMFVDEARLAARITHPNVVATLDVVSQDEELLLVMEYVRGASLSRLLRALAAKSEHVPLRIAGAILSGVLHGLHAAHEAKNEAGQPLHIVHRDVSPQNVLVGTDGIARLLDFGVAKATGRWQSTREGQLKGKIAYMAPEQIATGGVTRQTDIYAATVVLWETLTGRRLFRADNEAKLMSMVLEGQVPPPSHIVHNLPPEIDAIVLRGLDPEPARRFATARGMAMEVEAVMGTAPPADVGEWVERVASDELRERADRIEAIERSVPSSPASTSSARAARQAAATLTGAAPPIVAPGASSGTLPPSVRDRPSQESHLAMVHGSPWLQAASRRTWLGVAAVTLLLAAMGGTAALYRPPTLAPTPVAPPVDSPQPSPAAAAVSPAAAITAHASPAASARTDSGPPPPAVGRGGRVAPGRAPIPAARPDCSPPYTTDRLGHVHFKPACL